MANAFEGSSSDRLNHSLQEYVQPASVVSSHGMKSQHQSQMDHSRERDGTEAVKHKIQQKLLNDPEGLVENMMPDDNSKAD